jgi:phosphoenolpyruvate carboxykinase (ATP)
MDNILEKRLLSISQTLKSTSRSTGPRLFNKTLGKVVGGRKHSNESDFAEKVIEVFYNMSVPEYYEHSLKEPGTMISASGALISYSGKKTGRSPTDKRIVETDKYNDKIWWGKNSPNISMSKSDFKINRETAICYLDNLDKIFVFDGFAGWAPEHRIKVRVISSRAYHCLFMNNMLIRPTDEELLCYGEPDFVIYNAGSFPCNRYTGNMTSSTSIDLNFDTKEIVILGTQYAGEMKKGIFSVMNFFMPLKGHLSLHSSCNVSQDGDNSCLFFGLSGTGKTTLSADGSRKLIGDDEHVWTEEGVFNIEGGCYAKVINLNPEKEPEIYNAIRFGALLENVMIDSKRRIDFNDGHITQNTRVAYPIEHIDSALIPCVTCHPKNVILLTCDAFGVLPPVSKLSKEQAMYHFINGYTAKVAGTEDGVKEPIATFSACYGEAFIVWHPMKYAEMLSQKMEKHGVDCWLVNTGWVGGKYGVGKRCDIKATKKIVEEIHNGNLKQQEYEDFGVFNLQIPKNVDGVESRILNPENCWEDKGEYKAMLEKLAKLFLENAEKYNLDDYGDCFKDIISLN